MCLWEILAEAKSMPVCLGLLVVKEWYGCAHVPISSALLNFEPIVQFHFIRRDRQRP